MIKTKKKGMEGSSNLTVLCGALRHWNEMPGAMYRRPEFK